MADTAAAFIPMVTGSISFISSITVMGMICRSKSGLSTPYHRILFAISTADYLSSIGMSTGPFLAPEDTPHLWKSFGAQSTCDVQGFIFLLGALARPLYDCSLQIYYLCMIKYDMENKDIRRQVEPYLHCIPILYAMIGSITCLATGSINASVSWCHIESVPHECYNNLDAECTRGKNTRLLRGLFGSSHYFTSLIFISIVMRMIYRKIRKRDVAMQWHSSGIAAPDLNVNEELGHAAVYEWRSPPRYSATGMTSYFQPGDIRRTNKMVNRIMQYYVAFLIANFFPFLVSSMGVVGGIRLVPLLILQSIFYPLQGFYTLVLFIHPRFMTIRSSDEGLSVRHTFFAAIRSYGGAGGEVNAATRNSSHALVSNVR